MEIICLTSNDYAHMVGAFGYLFRKFWSEETPVTVLRYDVRAPNVGGNFRQTAIGMQEDFSWSEGLKSWLEKSGPEQFILMLEDYWLREKVNEEAVQEAWYYMEDNQKAGKIDLSGDMLNREHVYYEDLKSIKLARAREETQFLTSIQAAIWNRDFMLRLLDPIESAWQFEKNGSGRLRQAWLSGECEEMVLGLWPGAVSYVNACGGEGNLPGKYDHKKIPGWMWLELVANGLVD